MGKGQITFLLVGIKGDIHLAKAFGFQLKSRVSFDTLNKEEILERSQMCALQKKKKINTIKASQENPYKHSYIFVGSSETFIKLMFTV